MNLRQAFQIFMSYFEVQRQAKVNLPYSYKPANKYEPAQLEVKYPCAEAIAAGYARAIRLPCLIAGVAWDYPQGTLIVRLTLENETVATGYADAIDLPRDQRGAYSEYVCAPVSVSISQFNIEAMSENLDEFLQIDCEYEGALDYQTFHGLRSLDSDRPEHNQFLVTKKGNGFARPKDLPYLYFPAKGDYPSQLVIQCVCAEARCAGYAPSLQLPYFITGEERFYPEDDYPIGTLVVHLTTENEPFASGYANAVPLPLDRNSIYIENLNIIDTDYAAKLVEDF